MIKKLSVLFLMISVLSFAQSEREVPYIRKYAKLAVQEMHLYKIPASITLAQGILETGGGQSRLAEKANNHFGIKCKVEWRGETIYHDDDAKGECFRKYPSVEESYRDHSKFLAERPFYKALFKLELTNYKGWSHGLKKAGYATNPNYGPILIKIIERNKLNAFDTLKPEEVEAKLVELYGTDVEKIAIEDAMEAAEKAIEETTKSTEKVVNAVKETEAPKREIIVERAKPHPISRIKRHANGRQYVILEEGETITQLSELYDIKANKLLRYNEIDSSADLIPSQPIFLSKKKKKGKNDTYTVENGDTLYLISQKVGVRLKSLYKYNDLAKNIDLEPGTVINLR